MVRTDRRRAILEVAAWLADRGYDAVQIRDVAREAGVSLQAVHNHFAGNDVLVDEVLAEGVVGDTPVDRVDEVLMRTLDRALLDRVRLRTCIQAFVMPEPMGIEATDQMVTTFGKLLFMAIGDEVDDDRRIDATRIIGSVWFAAFMAWMTERCHEAHMRDMLCSAIRVSLG